MPANIEVTQDIGQEEGGAIGIRGILMKPALRARLAEKVREVLDAEPEVALLSG